MKIAIDVTRAIIENAGIGRYTFEIVQNMIRQDNKNEYLVYSTHYNDSADKDKRLKSFAAKNVKIKRFRIPGRVKEILWGAKINFFGGFLEDCDLLFAPSNFEVILGAKIPQVVTIHDLTTFIFPAQRGKKESDFVSRRIRQTCQVAKKIICVSKSTKSDLQKYVQIDPGKIEVVYSGWKKFDKIADKLPFNLVKKRYILSVGTIEPRKNLVGLLRAYALLDDELKNQYPLVLVGGKGWNDSAIFEELNTLKLKNFVNFTGFVKDDELARLYEDCKVFAYVSLYEGFGLPVVEALSFGVPVITSNVSSLPEVAGKSAVLVNPNDEKEIAKTLRRLLLDERYSRMIATGAKSQAQKFSWEDSAKQTLEIIEAARN